MLTVNEAAVIVGMLKANSTYNPRAHPEKSLQRRNVVIEQMVKYSYLSNAEGDFYKAEPLGLHYKVISYNQGPAPYFVKNSGPSWLNGVKNTANLMAPPTIYILMA